MTLICDTDRDEDAHTTLDKGELKFAMGLLWEKLDDMAGGRVPYWVPNSS